MDTHDLIIVGAGPFGLIAAHTWLTLHPNDDILVLETGPDLGGVWSKSRVYPTMMTQSPFGMLEYSCFPMPRDLPSSQTFYDFFPGHHVNSYLEDFATHKLFNGKTLKERIRFGNKVESVKKEDGLWIIQGQGHTFRTRKLIISTGLTSVPNLPSFATSKSSTTTVPIIHSINLASSIPILSSPSIKNILLVGGAKSAFDALLLLNSLSTPKKTTWLIRSSSFGPALLAAPSASPLPWPNSHYIISTRIVALMSPCIFEPPSSLTSFFHSSTVGKWMVDKVWEGVDWMWKREAGYERSEDMKRLKPERDAFWSSDRIAVYNSKGMWNLVAQASVLRDEVVKVDGKIATLASGKEVECDAIIAATGWGHSYPFFDAAHVTELGLPLPAAGGEEAMQKWEKKLDVADRKVIELFPRLKTRPSFPDSKPSCTPNTLYRSIAPLPESDEEEDRSIVFLGAIGTVQSFTVAEIQALWAAAYLDGALDLPDKEKLEETVAESIAWRRRRYLGDGETFMFDQIQYTAMLLRDLGLDCERKGGGWKEFLSPYQASDYRGIVDEWMQSQGKR